jgi:DNA-binding response OmpR family regulator
MEVIAIGKPTHVIGQIEARGLNISLAFDGIAGLRAILRRNADLALVEVDLPHLNGINLAKIIGLLEFKTPLVFTAESGQFRERTMSNGNVVDYILHSEIKEKFTEELLAKFQVQAANSVELPFTMNGGEWHNLFTAPGRKRLLFVEDEPDMALLVTGLLKQLDEYEMFVARDGLEGLRKAVTVNPDLIVADIDMPVLDGLSMSQILFMLGKPYPIVFLTSKKDDELINKAKNLDGVVGYMHKDKLANPTEFRREISRHLKMGSLAAETSAISYEAGEVETLARTRTPDGGVVWLD